MTRLAVFTVIAPLFLAVGPAPATAHRIAIVAAENFYGDVAAQIGGPDVTVHSILSNPDEDPHLFEASPSVGRDLSVARIAIYSGIDYDPWMPKLLRATHAPGRQVIVVADLVGRKPGDNPHIWYDPATMPALADRLAAELTADDPAHKAGYEQRLARFKASMQAVLTKVAALRQRLAGTPVIATEPVFGYMFAALGMDVHDMPFQIAVMNNTEPAASDVAAFENDLRNHRVRLLVYNSQASDPIAVRMMRLAKASHIPVVGATETEPPGKTYQAWMLGELDAIDHALPR
ncbi:MAG TPA: zinc ABC transporter substrate-binding protein [Acetobacteraceae bacterium]|nr:zinc ABC transporter substrate-binding protein [Acetobacteraceae bacterium]